MSDFHFSCPFCRGLLSRQTSEYSCPSCKRVFPIVDGVPDFFVSETAADAIDEPNKTWLDPAIVNARDTTYRLCARELKGMAFCMAQVDYHCGAGSRILEVGMGTGHFTRWLTESAPGAKILSFDFSWPIIHKACENTQGLANVTIFRANARGPLPFDDEKFDCLLIRLAPLGQQGTPNLEAAYKLLRPGGWYFEVGWANKRHDTPFVNWATQHGYVNVESHEWAYWRRQS